MLSRLVALSVQYRTGVAGGLLVLLVAGGFAAARLPIDAMPDVSTVQVAVLTEAPGLSPIEVERMVTAPIELAFNGLPRLSELRSVSRPGLSAVTVVFDDSMDVWFARQLVSERLREVTADLPAFVPPPQLAPVSTGLGEIYIFVVRSETGDHSAMQLRTMLDWEVVPKIRAVPGVIEVNPMGGELKQYHVVTSPSKLKSFGLTLSQMQNALERSSSSVGAGYVEREGENILVRGNGRLLNEEDIANVIVRGGSNPVLVKQIADVKIGSALRYGVTTRDAEGEVVTGTVMMLLGANSRSVTAAVKDRVAEVQKTLPPGVVIDTIYDRSDFVNATVGTVIKNIIEGALVVLLVLAVFLGTVRGAIAVVLGIPASMTIALFGMHLFGVTGDLMSLGAIDFGFLVDGPIVVLEAIIASLAGRHFRKKSEITQGFIDSAAPVARPVAFSVAIIMLVYIPLLALQGVEGKMFRPMATVMACALFGALVYSVVFFPGVVALLMPPPKNSGPRWLGVLREKYERLLPGFISKRWVLLAAMSVALVVSMYLLLQRGADFVPRIQEGDIVVTIRRTPSIGLTEARRLDLEAEKVLKSFPEVITTLAFTGRAELAFDPVGNDNTDMFVRLKPEEEWTSAHDLDELSEVIKERIESQVAGTFVSVSQPIEDRTNELISGSRADVAIQIFGADLDTLVEKSNAVGDVVRKLQGTGDVRIERLLGMPNIVFTPDRERLARYGVELDDVFRTLEAARVGARVGVIYEGPKRFEVRLLSPPTENTRKGLGDLFVETSDGHQVSLDELGSLEDTEGPATVRRENFMRTVRVEVNLRGRDLASWVAEAQATVQKEVPLPTGYNVTWGGQFENLERAQQRLAIVVPLALLIILGMLVMTFGSVRVALGVFSLVPLALIGGAIGLLVRGMNFSLPAAVGFIALAGVAVLNGVVMTTDVKKLLDQGESLDKAVLHGAAHTLRAVLTTAAVAALGFFPMAINTGAGSEVQRPLATVVVFGIVGATVLMLVVFPGILKFALSKPATVESDDLPQPDEVTDGPEVLNPSAAKGH
ncbi:MAG: CusA/CzcA family heavy metal efflux RND transporter [Archangium gephyra]|uniref:CusA/CzcA family heavy metal efflux RND transporter n=1 Tax=Archangium gephyra TaxID=48 RepID=A0A2W5SYU6_9BACT|nr:MAG: CusA/CzcA family heavy metal efflux RND transporter [Archangium gephyra]